MSTLLQWIAFDLLPFVSLVTLGVAAVRFAWVSSTRPAGLFHQAHYAWTLLNPWRSPQEWWLALGRWWEKTWKLGKGGSAHWSSMRGTMTLTYKPGDLYLGTQWAWDAPTIQPIGFETTRHVAMISAAGTGKTTHAITQIALHADAGGSVCVIDPKGEIATVLAPNGGKVIDPYHIVRTEVDRVCFNPMDELARFQEVHAVDAAVRFTAVLAEALIRSDPNAREQHWTNSARELVTAVVLYVLVAAPAAKRNLVYVRELLVQGLRPDVAGADAFEFLLETMAGRDDFGGVISARANALLQTSDRERGSILSTARVQTAWLDYPEIRAIMTRSTFRLEELKSEGPDALKLFFSAPASEIAGPLSGFSRLLLNLVFYTFENTPGRLDIPCYVVVDEFANLGHLTAIEKAAPLMRGYGIRLQVIAQSLGQIKAVYPKTWEGFLASTDAVMWMGTGAMEDALYLSGSLGDAVRKEKLDGSLLDEGPTRTQKVVRPLATPDQVRRFLGGGTMIVTRMNRPPLRLKSSPYFKHLPVWLYEPHPDFSESPLRAMTRRLFGLRSPALQLPETPTPPPSASAPIGAVPAFSPTEG